MANKDVNIKKREDLAAPWEKRTNENKRDYDLFKAYCKLGNDRSIAKLAISLGISMATIKKIATDKSWGPRAKAYDDMVLKLRPQLQDITKEQSRQGQLEAARILLDLGIRAIEIKNPALINVDQATRLINAGVDMERKALGEADLTMDISIGDMSRVQKMLDDLDIEDAEIIDESEEV